MGVYGLRSYVVIFLGLMLIGNLVQSFWIAHESGKRLSVSSISEMAYDDSNPITFAIPDVVVYRIKQNDNIFDIMRAHGVEKESLLTLIRTAKPVFNLSRIQPGHVLHFQIVDNAVVYFKYYVTDDAYLEVRRKSDRYTAEMVTLSYDREVVAYELTIYSNLFDAADSANLPTQVVSDLADIYKYDIDFNREIRSGNKVVMLLEVFRRGDRVKYGRILAAKFELTDEVRKAFYFKDADHNGYYNESGRSMQKAFLRSPVRFSRISSGYTNRRYHPILKRYRPHRAIDYAAKSGTPVMTVGDGVVTYMGWKGSAGKVVSVRHRDGYSSLYAHLKGFKKGLRKGARVKQGDVIGYVGSTGLSSGPHCHFVFKRYGRPINPVKTSYMVKHRIWRTSYPNFIAVRDKLDHMIESTIKIAKRVP